VSDFVVSPAVPVPVRLAACHAAWRKARRGKRPSMNQLQFELHWVDALQTLTAQLQQGAWQPRRTVSFVVTHPKTREIHAPDFADRVVHHLLVDRLEKLYEPIFVFDSFANRTGKGSHAAVDRLQKFMRQQNAPCFYLQLDIHNFFNSIHRPTLYGMLQKRLAQCEARGKVSAKNALALRSLCHKLLANKVQEQVRNKKDAASVPPHKRLANAKPQCGLPVGNLTSQFFANVYLNALDQFVKHTLKVRHYVRYVDDFVLLSASRQELQNWHIQIADFLQRELHLGLNEKHQLQTVGNGIDFLGYRVFTHYRWVRPRVVKHCYAKLRHWQQMHAQPQRVTSDDFAKLQALVASYFGHFSHANSVRLRRRLFEDLPWLNHYFELQLEGTLQVMQAGKWQIKRQQRVRTILNFSF
jgi:RNA-directed DNA polymerase